MLRLMERAFLEVATVSVIVLAILIFVDVLAVNFFGSYVPDMIVMVRELMVLAIVLPLAAATANRSHIAVEFVTNMFPQTIVNWFAAFGTLFAFVALAPLIWSACQDLIYQLNVGSSFYGDLNLPQWPGRLGFLIGIVLCWLRLGTLIFMDFATALKGTDLPQPDTDPNA
ncbi:hypothetical protein So717_41830 [Roseobacter cerasinus]|uniref:TRAP transporter small permease protein n=1 Tax=Roseobacter cerasinus TaxID=2602289 RepID=A0A640VYG2_9RHOB|nr:TRAP transporter small permease [Roseobacter cerasinus]GFE52430.1 hypothetical protein So717_41830 [Roseobacter cerasinus]